MIKTTKTYILFSLISLAHISMFGMDRSSRNADDSYEDGDLPKNINPLRYRDRTHISRDIVKLIDLKNKTIDRNKARRYKLDRLSGKVS